MTLHYIHATRRLARQVGHELAKAKLMQLPPIDPQEAKRTIEQATDFFLWEMETRL